ncbi:hypothetical protein AB6D92_04990 [Vibrio splendidus]
MARVEVPCFQSTSALLTRTADIGRRVKLESYYSDLEIYPKPKAKSQKLLAKTKIYY